MKHASKRFTRELGPLVAVEHLRPAMEPQRIFQADYTEQSLKAVADSPAQYKPRVPINDRHPIGKALAHPDVGDELAARLFVGGVVPCLNEQTSVRWANC